MYKIFVNDTCVMETSSFQTAYKIYYKNRKFAIKEELEKIHIYVTLDTVLVAKFKFIADGEGIKEFSEYRNGEWCRV